MPTEDKSSLTDRLTIGFSRAVTRRTVLSRGLKLAAGSAVAASGALYFPRRASADNPQCNFTVGNWGCHCASTPSCGKGRCCRTLYGQNTKDACCGSARERCNYWSRRPYCWCSKKCCLRGQYGYYSCCDCWRYGQTSGCKHGNTKCICKGRHRIRSC